MAALVSGGIRSFAEAFDRDAAQLRTTATAIAIERYRLANNKLPDSLDALVPTYLNTVPLDPFDEKPLRYSQKELGYTVYSIGSNLRDEQGATQQGNDIKTGDIVLIVNQ
jgi:hypothetical protein